MKKCQSHNTLTVRTLLRVFMGSIQERRGLFWVRHEQIGGLSAFAARSAVAKVEAARWGLGSYGRFRTWCEAYPSTSMAPTSCGWVLGGSCSGFLALCRS